MQQVVSECEWPDDPTAIRFALIQEIARQCGIDFEKVEEQDEAE